MGAQRAARGGAIARSLSRRPPGHRRQHPRRHAVDDAYGRGQPARSARVWNARRAIRRGGAGHRRSHDRRGIRSGARLRLERDVAPCRGRPCRGRPRGAWPDGTLWRSIRQLRRNGARIAAHSPWKESLLFMTRSHRLLLHALVLPSLALSVSCLDTSTGTIAHASCALSGGGASSGGAALVVSGCGLVDSRYTAEVAVHQGIAYTTTWGFRSEQGNFVAIWNVTGSQPTLLDSVIVSGATTLGDVAVTDDGTLLIVATERTNGSLVIFDLADPVHPHQLARLATPETFNGVHTAEVGRVAGHLYAILAVDALNGGPSPESKIVIVDLADPANPRQIFVKSVPSTAPFVHDTFLRDGLLLVALWNAGIEIWDLGGGGHGGTPTAPVVIGSVATIGGDAHNIWWLHDA